MDSSKSDPTYDPLLPQEIRLLKLGPGKWDDEIQCDLIHTSVTNKSGYIALSYAWGSSKLVRSITLNGEQRFVTVSANNALRRLRETFGKVTVWVDALCINQADEGERNNQVALMRAIYTSACQVVVYLGEVRDSGVSMRTSRRETSTRPIVFPNTITGKGPASFSNHCHSVKAAMHSGINEAVEVFCLIRSIAESRNLADTAPFDSDSRKAADSKYQRRLFEALRQLIRCRWWDRMWTLQEVVLPKNVTILYGPCVSPWDMFARAANTYSTRKNSLDYGSVPLAYTKVLEFYTQTVLDIEAMRTRWATQEPSSLLPLLRQFSGRKATDARDRVYALLGLVRGDLPVQPNYALGVVAVFQGTVLGIIDKTTTLDVLNGDIGRKSRQDLPSWVPDWTAEYYDLERRRAETVHLYEASCQCSIYVQWDNARQNDGTRQYLARLWKERGYDSMVPIQWSADQCTKVLGASGWKAFLEIDLRDGPNPCSEFRRLRAVEHYLTSQCRPCCLRYHGDDIISLPGLKIGNILALGQVILSDQDVAPVIQSWALMAAEYLEGPKAWISFITTMCADIVWVKSWDGTTCRRTSANEHKALVFWFLHQQNAPFGVNEARKNPHLFQIRDALLQLDAELEDSALLDETLDVEQSIRLGAIRRRFFITGNHEFGLGPAQASVGDQICTLLGARTPFILRKVYPPQTSSRSILWDLENLEFNCRKIVGDCYVHGAMDGKAMSSWPDVSSAAMKSTTSSGPSTVVEVREGLTGATQQWENALHKIDLLNLGRSELTEAIQYLGHTDPSAFQTFSENIRSRREHARRQWDLGESLGQNTLLPKPDVTSGEENWMLQNGDLFFIPNEYEDSIPFGSRDEVVMTRKRFEMKEDLITKEERSCRWVADTARQRIVEWEYRYLSQRSYVFLN